MTERVLVAGSGIAGLSAAMALARPGREVVVLDRDPAPPDSGPEDAFAHWERKGVTQLRHSHVFLGRLVKLIRERHPKLWQDLLDAGCREFTFEDALPPALRAKYTREPGDEDMSMLFSRRTTLELVMRRYAAGLDGVTFVTNAGLRSAVSERRGGQLAVTGVRATNDDGEEQIFTADAIVDAMGRYSPFPDWLQEAGARIPEEPSPAGILYFTRHYRLREGMEEPERDGTPGGGDLGYIKFGLFPADNRHFSVTLACPEIERELRIALNRPEIFDGACARMPATARWTAPERAEPVSKVFAMGNLKNVWRRFTKDGTPAALNYFPIGDAALRTNPLYGRGCSTAAIQAHLLADVFDSVPDTAARMIELEKRVTTEIRPFFDVMAQQDAQAIKRAVAEQTPDHRPSLKGRLVRSFLQDAVGPATRGDLHVLRPLMRAFHMLENPTRWTRSAPVMARVLRIWATPKFLKRSLYLPELGPKRTEMLRELGLATS